MHRYRMKLKGWQSNFESASLVFFAIAYIGYSAYMYTIMFIFEVFSASDEMAILGLFLAFSSPLMMLAAFFLLVIGIISGVASLRIGPIVLCLIVFASLYGYIDNGLFWLQHLGELREGGEFPGKITHNLFYNVLIILFLIRWNVVHNRKIL